MQVNSHPPGTQSPRLAPATSPSFSHMSLSASLPNQMGCVPTMCLSATQSRKPFSLPYSMKLHPLSSLTQMPPPP